MSFNFTTFHRGNLTSSDRRMGMLHHLNSHSPCYRLNLLIHSEPQQAKVVEQLKSRSAAFFEMELGCEDVVARNRRAERNAVVARRDRHRRIVWHRVV